MTTDKIFLALYVDNLLIVWSSKESLAEVKERLKMHLKMKYMGSAHFLLGVEIRRMLDGGYFMAQEKYAPFPILHFLDFKNSRKKNCHDFSPDKTTRSGCGGECRNVYVRDMLNGEGRGTCRATMKVTYDP